MNSDLVQVEELLRRVLLETFTDWLCAVIALYVLVEFVRWAYWKVRDLRTDSDELEHPEEFTEP